MTNDNTRISRQISSYTFWSIIIGLCFPIITLIVDIRIIHDLPLLDYSSIVRVHRESAFYWIIDLMPIILGGLAYVFARRFASANSRAKSKLKHQQKRTENIFLFTEKLRNGEIEAQYELADEDDELGKSLINLRDNLKQSKEEEEARRKEDDQRHWATEGIAKFSEILRQYSDNIEKLSYEIISNLSKYIDAIQGGVFVLQESLQGEKYFELYAHYAYERKKFADRRIEWGEGLIGACAMEKETVFITDVTEGYVNVTSGLGKSNPRCILIVPLKINEEVHGVIEFASFNQIEKYQIEFVEKLAESIASTIASYKINARTAQLLKESQEQAKKMADQEELMRKNLEELQITQEEAAKQSEQFVSFTNSVNHTLIRAEYNIEGELLYANTKFIKKLGYSSNSDVESRHISIFINEKDIEWFNKIWDGLAKGGRHFENYMKHVTKDGKDLWTMATYTCVRDKNGDVEKILFLAIDTTEQKKQSLDFEGQIEALNRSNLKVVYSPGGTVLECNRKYIEAIEYTTDKIKGKSVFEIIDPDEQRNFKVVWNNVVNGIPFEGQIKQITNNNNLKWFQATYTAVNDMYGDIAKIIFLANDITAQKELEFKQIEQTKQLKIQEERLQESEKNLSKMLDDTKEKMRRQFRKIEIVKMLNERTLEGMLDAVITINRDNKFEFFNKAAEDLWKTSREDMINEDVSLLFPPMDGNEQEAYMGTYFKFGEKSLLGKRKEVFIIDKDGERIPVLLELSEARIGKEYNLTAFVRNIEVELF